MGKGDSAHRLAELPVLVPSRRRVGAGGNGRVSRRSGSAARRRTSCEATPARHVESRSESLAVAALQHGRASIATTPT
jgi:hypothetical protein